MTIEIDSMFFRSPVEKRNCEEFANFCNKYKLNKYITSASTATWQFDMRFDNGAVMSFWPHKLRAVDQTSYKAYDFTSWEDSKKLIDAISK